MMMYKLNIVNAIRKMTINKLRDFFYENYYSKIRFTKENSFYSIKRQKKRFTIILKQIFFFL